MEKQNSISKQAGSNGSKPARPGLKLQTGLLVGDSKLNGKKYP